MKHCPYCGTPLRHDNGIYCPDCGRELKNNREKITPKHVAAKPAKKRKTSKAKRSQRSPAAHALSMDEDYDGYYDDVLPADGGATIQGLDRKVVKNIILLITGVLLIVGACVCVLYFL